MYIYIYIYKYGCIRTESFSILEYKYKEGSIL